MDGLKAVLAEVQRQIGEVVADVEAAVAQGRAEDVQRLSKREDRLRRKEEQLREKELIALRASGKQYCLTRLALCMTRRALSAKQVCTFFRGNLGGAAAADHP